MSAPLISDSIDELENKFGNRYDLVMIAARRAKELQEGKPPYIRTESTNPLTIALEEIEAGKYPLPEGAEAELPPVVRNEAEDTEQETEPEAEDGERS